MYIDFNNNYTFIDFSSNVNVKFDLHKRFG